MATHCSAWSAGQHLNALSNLASKLERLERQAELLDNLQQQEEENQVCCLLLLVPFTTCPHCTPPLSVQENRPAVVCLLAPRKWPHPCVFCSPQQHHVCTQTSTDPCLFLQHLGAAKSIL